MRKSSINLCRIAMVFVLSLSLVISPSVFGSSYLDSARYAVQMAKRRADAEVQSLVEQDFLQVLNNITEQTKSMQSQQQKVGELIDGLSNLRNEFLAFSREPYRNQQISRAQLLKDISYYEDLYRQLFAASWKTVETFVRYQQFGGILQSFVHDYARTCKLGRADAAFNTDVPITPAPPGYSFDFNFYLNEPDGSQGYYFNSENYDHDRGRGKIINYSEQVAGIGTAIGTSATGTLATWAFVAGGVSAAVFLTAVAVSYLSSSQNAFNTMKSYVNAQLYKFRNMPRSNYIAAHYRKACQKNLPYLTKIADAINTVEAGGPKAAVFLKRLNQEKSEVKRTEAKMKRLSLADCHIQLAQEYKQGQCHTSGSSCVVQNGQVRFINNQCSLAIEKGGNLVSIKKDREFANKVASDSSFQTNVERALVYNAVQELTTDKQQTLGEIENYAWAQLDEAQQRAFLRLTKIVIFANQLAEGSDPTSALILKDLNISGQYRKYNAQFLDLVAMAIKTIFGEVSPLKFRAQLENLQKRVEKFQNQYTQVFLIQNLSSRIGKLKNIMESDGHYE